MVVAVHPLRRRTRRTGLRPLTLADLRRLKFGMLYFGVMRDVDLQCPRCLTGPRDWYAEPPHVQRADAAVSLSRVRAGPPALDPRRDARGATAAEPPPDSGRHGADRRSSETTAGVLTTDRCAHSGSRPARWRGDLKTRRHTRGLYCTLYCTTQ